MAITKQTAQGTNFTYNPETKPQRISMSGGSYVPDSQIQANVDAAAKLGVAIPGVGGKTVPVSNASPALTALSIANSPINTINSDTLKGTQAFDVPNVAPSTAVTGELSRLGTQTAQNVDQYTASLQAQADATATSEQSSFEKLMREMLDAPTKSGIESAEYATKGGVNDTQTELNNINNQILQEQQALRDREKEIDKNPNGMLRGAVEAEKQKVRDESLSRQADLAVIQMSIQGRYNSAKEIADRAVTAKFDAAQQRIIILGLIYDRNKSLFDKSEQRAFENAQAYRKSQVEMEMYKEKARYDQLIKENDPLYRKQLAESGTSNLELRNVGTNDAPIWKNYNKVTGELSDPVGFAQSAQGGVDAQKAIGQLDFLISTANSAEALSGASGTSSAFKFLGDTFVGDSDYRRLESFVNTLKTNMLTLATDPNVKKFFGPQMSNADVELMTSAGTTLNPAKQSPADMQAEIKRLIPIFNKLKVAAATTPVAPRPENVVLSPDEVEIEIVD